MRLPPLSPTISQALLSIGGMALVNLALGDRVLFLAFALIGLFILGIALTVKRKDR
jgi:hypothetical protein